MKIIGRSLKFSKIFQNDGINHDFSSVDIRVLQILEIHTCFWSTCYLALIYNVLCRQKLSRDKALIIFSATASILSVEGCLL